MTGEGVCWHASRRAGDFVGAARQSGDLAYDESIIADVHIGDVVSVDATGVSTVSKGLPFLSGRPRWSLVTTGSAGSSRRVHTSNIATTRSRWNDELSGSAWYTSDGSDHRLRRPL